MPLPIEPVRNWYVTLFGGTSRELEPDQVGVNKEALQKNTDLTPYLDKVSIKRLEKNRAVPYFKRRFFEVIPLDEYMPDALSKSPNGEAVLPNEAELVEGPRRMDLMDRYEPLILNSVLSKILNRPEEWTSLLKVDFSMEKRIRFQE